VRSSPVRAALAFALVPALVAVVLASPLSAQAGASGAPAPRAKPAPLPADSMEIARKYTQWLYTAMADSLAAHGTEDAKAEMTKEFYTNALLQITTNAGAEETVLEEKFVTRNGARQYWRTAKFSGYAEPVMIRWVITPKGEIAGLGMNPESQAPPIDPE
jgi:hypothetical protein